MTSRKIYNEVVLIWNDKTNQYDTIYEDSYQYDGDVEQLMARKSGGLEVNVTDEAGPAIAKLQKHINKLNKELTKSSKLGKDWNNILKIAVSQKNFLSLSTGKLSTKLKTEINRRKVLKDLQDKDAASKTRIRIAEQLRNVNNRLKQHNVNLKSITKGTNLVNRAMKGEAKALGEIRRRMNELIRTGKLHGKQLRGFQVRHHRNAMSLSRFRSQLLMAAFAYGTFIAPIGRLLKLYMQQEKAERKLAQALRSTGHAAQLSSQELIKYAASLQQTTGIGDELTIASSAMLATFTQISGNTFKDAQVAILDVATAMNHGVATSESLRTATIQIGKALNDPIKGITALSRVGIQLSDNQKDLIKRFMATGDVASAQSIIIEELNTQFGGMAEAMRHTTEGRINAMKGALSDLGEAVGAGLSGPIGVAAEKIKEFAENLDAEKLTRYTFALAAGFAAWKAIGLIVLAGAGALKIYNTTLTRTAFLQAVAPKSAGTLVQTLGAIAAAGATDYFLGTSKAFQDLYKEIKRAEDVLLEYGESIEGMSPEQIKIAENIDESVKSLEKQKELLFAVGNIEKAMIELKYSDNVRELTDEEKLLIEQIEEEIIARDELAKKLKREEMAQKQLSDLKVATMKESLNLLNVFIDQEKSALDEKMNQDIDRVRKTSAFLRAQKRGDQKEMDRLEKNAAKKTLADRRKVFRAKQLSDLASIAMDTVVAIMKTKAQLGPAALPLIPWIQAQGALAAGVVMAQQPPKFARGGDFVTEGPQTIVVGDNPGGRERVQVTPLSSPNFDGPSGGSVNITFTGNVMSQDFIEQEAIPQIKEAIRRGADIGVS